MFELSRWEIDDYATMEELPMVQGHRVARILNPGKAGRAFGYHHGCGHGRKPRSTR